MMPSRKPHAFLFVDDAPMMFQRELARTVGLDEAIVIQQLHYLLTQTEYGREVEGRKWIFNTHEEWQRNWFPFWSLSKVQKLFLAMENDGLLESCQPEGGISRRKYYRLPDAWYVRDADRERTARGQNGGTEGGKARGSRRKPLSGRRA